MPGFSCGDLPPGAQIPAVLQGREPTSGHPDSYRDVIWSVPHHHRCHNHPSASVHSRLSGSAIDSPDHGSTNLPSAPACHMLRIPDPPAYFNARLQIEPASSFLSRLVPSKTLHPVSAERQSILPCIQPVSAISVLKHPYIQPVSAHPASLPALHPASINLRIPPGPLHPASINRREKAKNPASSPLQPCPLQQHPPSSRLQPWQSGTVPCIQQSSATSPTL